MSVQLSVQKMCLASGEAFKKVFLNCL